MAKPRSLQILADQGAQGHYFHIVSRVVDKRGLIKAATLYKKRFALGVRMS